VRHVIQYISHLDEGWLLVFDNYDLPEQHRFDLRAHFPEGSNGQIIVTSRNRDVEQDIGGNALHVNRMSDEEAVRLLLKSAGLSSSIGNDEEEALQNTIATEILGSLPLAIAQGGAFIKQRRIANGQATIQRLRKYREIFEEHQAKMLNGESGALVTRYGKSIITSWDISFRVVKSDNPIAAELFLLLGFLHHTNIREDLFRNAHNYRARLRKDDDIDITAPPYQWVGEILSSNRYGQWDDSVFSTSMAVLESFSLIRNFDDNTYHMHPLVHEWTKVGDIGSKDEIEARARLAIAMLSTVHRRDLNKYSVARQVQQTQYTSHLASCLTSTERNTTLLNPESQNKLPAITLLRLARLLDGELLPTEQKAQKLQIDSPAWP
jgi:NB-ARC domain